MACSLKDDPTHAVTFLAPAGSTSTLFAENNAGTAAIESALFNGASVKPDSDNKISITEKPGINILRYTVNGVQNGDEVRLKEDCGGGVSQLRQKWIFTGDPVREVQIHAS